MRTRRRPIDDPQLVVCSPAANPLDPSASHCMLSKSLLLLLTPSASLITLAWLLRRRQNRLRGSSASTAVPDTPTLFSHIERAGTHSVKHELTSNPHGLQMWVADMELPCCPSIVRAINERAAHPNYGYTVQPAAIWDAVSSWLVARQGWRMPPACEEFIFSASVVTSFCNVLRALTSEGDAVLVMTPLYAPLQRAVTGCGRRLVEHRLAFGDRCAFGDTDSPKAYQMDATTRLVERLDSEPSVRVLLLCNPHNPTGRVWRRAELAALARECAKRQILVVSDEIWADWVLPSACQWPFEPFANVAAAAGCQYITLGAPTKSFSLAGLHASYLILPDARLRRKYLEYTEPAFLTYGSVFATAAMLAAYSDAAAAWLDAARSHVADNVRYLGSFLHHHVPQVTVEHLEATYCAWLNLRCLQLDADETSARLKRAGLVLSPGREFDSSGASDCYQRINLACSRPVLELAASRIRTVVEERLVTLGTFQVV